jgi:putative component of membrane protein insertase Oxa1/YidC/SpoIIIJ protein YidD
MAVAAIGGYQRYLSPWKGFVCAHRAVHGGASCSQYVKRVFATEGAMTGLRSILPRFRACREALRAIRNREHDIALNALSRDAASDQTENAGTAPTPSKVMPCEDDACGCLIVPLDCACYGIAEGLCGGVVGACF